MKSVNWGNDEREKRENSIHVPLSISKDDNEGRSVNERNYQHTLCIDRDL